MDQPKNVFEQIEEILLALGEDVDVSPQKAAVTFAHLLNTLQIQSPTIDRNLNVTVILTGSLRRKVGQNKPADEETKA